MNDIAILDTNLTVLLVVGSASTRYIADHKRLDAYAVEDFELLNVLLADFTEFVFLPHVLAEVSNIARQIRNPARSRIQDVLQTLIATTPEVPIPSIAGARRHEFNALGLTDAVLLHFCGLTLAGLIPTLITVDSALANAASSLGYSVIDYKADFLAR